MNSDTWESGCNCRINKTECNDQCQCDPKVCKNR